MLFLLFLLVLSGMSPSLQVCPREGKREMEEFREDAEHRMEDALGEVDFSVLVSPLRELDELEASAKEDRDMIQSCTKPPDRCSLIRKSIAFWKQKMEDVITPFIQHPEDYQNLVIDFFPPPPDPTGNDSEEYKVTEKKLNDISLEAIAELESEFKKRTELGKCHEDQSEGAWKKLQAGRALDNAVFSITMTRQAAKVDAANGVSTQEESVKRLMEEIARACDEFYKKMNELYG